MADLTLFYAATPEEAYLITRDQTIPAQPTTDGPDPEGGGVVELVARRGGCPGGTAVQVSVPAKDARPGGPGRFLIDRAAITPTSIGRAYQPWHADVEPEPRQRWKAYLQPESLTLRNLIGAATPGALEAKETGWVEWRLLELAERPVRPTFDLDHLRAIHRRLFQDVYPWAGETRTVQMHRPNGPGFYDWEGIEDAYAQIQDRLTAAGHLRGATRTEFIDEAAQVYNAVNTVHAFREGNGRTQREWVSDLARAAGHELDWSRVHGFTNDIASQRAREGDLTALRHVLETITTTWPQPRPEQPPDPPGLRGRRTQSSPGPQRSAERHDDRPRPPHANGPSRSA